MRGLTTIVIVMSFFAIYGHGKTARAQPEQPLNVIYPLRVEAEKGPHDFILATLKLVLDKSEIPYKMRPTSIPMQQTRAMERLKDGKDVTIYWAGTSPEFETEFLPIRIPIMRGLLGYRLMIIRKDRQKIFDTIMTLSQLAPFMPDRVWAGPISKSLKMPACRSPRHPMNMCSNLSMPGGWIISRAALPKPFPKYANLVRQIPTLQSKKTLCWSIRLRCSFLSTKTTRNWQMQ